MKHFHKRLLVALLALASLPAMGQSRHWAAMMEDPKTNFHEIKASFEAYWSNIPESERKGKGWKPFMRWLEFMEPRVGPSGERIDPSLALREYERFKASYPTDKSLTGNWTPMGPTAPGGSVPNGSFQSPGGSGRVNFIGFDPGYNGTTNRTIWAGTPSGGLWKSTDGGGAWTTSTDQLGSIGVSGVTIDPTNPSNMWIATGDCEVSDTYSVGIMKSTDGGASWLPTAFAVNQANSYRITTLLMDGDSPSQQIAACNGVTYYTSDGWTSMSVAGNMNGKIIDDLEFKPGTSDETVYAAGTDGTAALFLVSTDGGQSFTVSGTGLPTTNVSRMELAVSAAQPNYVWALLGKDDDQGYLGLYRSTNGGTSFASVNLPTNNGGNLLGWSPTFNDDGGQAWYDLTLQVNPANANVIYVGGVNLNKSTDGGSTWTCNGYWLSGAGYSYLHADHHYLVYAPGSSTQVFSGNDGGIAVSNNDGVSWTEINSNMAIAQVAAFGTSASNPGLILTGMQDNGTNLLRNGAWNIVSGGDGCEAIIHPTNESIMFASYVQGSIYRSTNGGASWTTVSTTTGGWITPYVMDPNNPNIMYKGNSTVQKSTNNGVSWANAGAFASPTLASSYPVTMAMSAANSSVIYAANNQQIWKSTNGATSWTGIIGTLPVSEAYITYIGANPNDANDLTVTFSGFVNGKKVYRSTDGGATWTNLSLNLPNLPVNTVVYEKNSAVDARYLGTDLGVYYTDNSMTQWAAFDTGLPNVIVKELEIFYHPTDACQNRLRAATYGRSVWESDLYGATGTMTLASTTASHPSTAVVSPGTANAQMMRLQVETSGCGTTLSATQFSFSTNGSTAPAADIASAKLFYTGTSASFSTAQPFGAAVANPNGTFSFSGAQNLATGINNFWLVYDVAAGASLGNVLDAECASVTIGGSPVAPVPTAPTGNRPIDDPCAAVTAFPWTEGFEGASLPQCWSQAPATGAPNWTYLYGNGASNPTVPHTGSYNAVLKDASATSHRNKLITKKLNLSLLGSPTLTFWHTQDAWSGDQDELRVYYRTAETEPWNLIQLYVSDVTTWTQRTLALPNPSATYQIAFEGDARYGYGVCIDDIGVNGTLLASPVVNTVSPASFFADKGKQLTVLGNNLSGATVSLGGVAGTVDSNNGSTLVATFPAGSYSNNTLTISTGTLPNATATVQVLTRDTIPVGGGTDSHATLQSAVNGLWAWWGATAFDASKVILVHPGTYAEQVNVTQAFAPTATNRLVFKAASGRPLVDATGKTYGFNIDAAAKLNHVSLEGLEVANSFNSGVYIDGDGAILHNNIIRNGGSNLVYINGASPVLSYNLVRGATANSGVLISGGTNAELHHNLVHSNAYDGINLTGSANANLWNNTVWGNGNGSGGHALEVAGGSTGVVVKNNILVAKAGSAQYALLASGTSLASTSGFNTYYDSGNANFISHNGTLYGDLATWNATASGNDDLDADPLFVSAGTDFHPRSITGSYHGGAWPPSVLAGGTWTLDASTSPAVDAGDPADAFALEPDGNGGRVNQGCYGNTPQATKSGNIDMQFVSATATQSLTTPVFNGATEQQIMGVVVTTTGNQNPLSATALQFSTNGSTDALGDLTAARLYFTGGSASFATGTLLGTAVASPNGAFSFSGLGQVLATGDNHFWLAYDIAADATDANLVDAECASLTVGGIDRTPSPTAPAGNRPVENTDMVFVSATSTQDETSDVLNGSTNQQIMAVQIVTTGSTSALAATQLRFNTTGTTAAADLDAARLFYTGASGVFSTAAPLGSPVLNPSGTFSFGFSQTLVEGTNYFWLAYDVDADAPSGNLLDAQCVQLTVGGASSAPTVTAPAGNRPVFNDDMYVLSATTVQASVDNVFPSATRAQILDVQVVTDGSFNPIALSELNFSTLGTTDAAGDILNAKLYFTGLSGTFDFTNLLGTFSNPNGNFAFSGMNVVLGKGTNHFWLTYDVATDATGGNLLDAQCLRLTADGSLFTPSVTDPAGSRPIDDASMEFVSATSTQANTALVGAGQANAEILGVEILTNKANNPLVANGFTFTTTGTSSAADLTSAKLFYTGTSTSFGTATQVGTAVANPNGTFSFAGLSQELAEGTNYFWLAYDIAAGATSGNLVDATCTQISLSDGNRAPSVTAPAGNREIGCATINTFPWREGFEGGAIPNCWTKTGTPTWNVQSAYAGTVTTTAQEGTRFAQLKDGTVTSNWSELISPVFDLTGLAQPRIGFWFIQEVGTTAARQDTVVLEVRASAAGPWYRLFSGPASQATWLYVSVTLPLASDEYQFRFVGDAKRGRGIGIDNIVIEDDRFCNSSAYSTGPGVEYISNVSMGSINNSSLNSFYTDYSNLSTEVEIGTATNLTVSVGNKYTVDKVNVWVDWNHDGDFEDASETVLQSTALGAATSRTVAVTPPASAFIGLARMRIVVFDSNEDDPVGPCQEYVYGETEDYTLNVRPASCAGTVYVATSANPWIEDFEHAGAEPACWGQNKLVGDVAWAIDQGNGGLNPAQAHGGDWNYVMIDTDGTTDQTRLISTCVDITALADPELSFFHAQVPNFTAQDELKIYYMYPGMDDWALLDGYTEATSGWEMHRYPLTFSTSRLYLAFEGFTKGGNGTTVDDVRIGEPEELGLWYGNISTDWRTSRNWGYLAIPDAEMDATIPAGRPNYPAVDEAAACLDLNIQDGGSVSVGTGAQLAVWGDLQVGQGASGSFAMTAGQAAVDGDLHTAANSSFSFSGGQFSATEWKAGISSPEALGTASLSGGTFSLAEGARFAATGFSGSMGAGLLFNVGARFVADGSDWTVTGGTLRMTGAGSSANELHGGASGLAAKAYDIELATGGETVFLTPLNGGSGVQALNNLTISSGTADTRQGTGTTESLAVGGSLIVADGGSFRRGDVGSYSVAAHSLSGASSYVYSGSGQTVANMPYGILGIEGSGTKVSASSLASPTTAQRLEVSSGASFQLLPNHAMTLAAGLANQGSLELLSDATGTASLIVSGTASGQASVQRHLPDADRYYYLFPPTDQVVANQEFAGAFALYNWNEQAGNWLNLDASSTNAVGQDKGFIVKYSTAGNTPAYTGELLASDHSVNLSFTKGVYKDGYNLIGNPYPSSLDWDHAAWSKPSEVVVNNSNTIWYGSSIAGAHAWATWNGNSGVGTNNGSPFVPAGQAFWIRYKNWSWTGNQNTVLTIPAAARTHEASPAGLYKATEKPLLRLRASNGAFYDEAVLCFIDQAGPGFEMYDSEKFFSPHAQFPQLYFPLGGGMLAAIDAMPRYDEELTVPMGFIVGSAGQFLVEASELRNFGADQIFLEDLHTGNFVDLRQQPSYAFAANAGNSPDRFLLHFLRGVVTDLPEAQGAEPSIFSNERSVYVSVPATASKQGSISIHSLLGQTLHTEQLQGRDMVRVDLGVVSGLYLVRLQTQDGVFSKTVFIE